MTHQAAELSRLRFSRSPGTHYRAGRCPLDAQSENMPGRLVSHHSVIFFFLYSSMKMDMGSGILSLYNPILK